MESAPNSSFSPRSLHAEAEGTALEPQSRRSSIVSECSRVGSGRVIRRSSSRGGRTHARKVKGGFWTPNAPSVPDRGPTAPTAPPLAWRPW
jgi:hypothetical protein